MTNELLFIVAVLINLTIILFSLRFGSSGLTAVITANLILVSIFAPKLLSIFGYTSNVGNIFYGSLFLATNLLIEQYGKKAGFKGIWVAFIANILFVTMGQFTMRFIGDPQSSGVNEAIFSLFNNSPRIAAASIIGYLLVQNFNVWFYNFIKQKTAGRYLWLRHGLSIVVAQFFDSLIFFSIAFYLIIPTNLLIEAMVIGFAIKAIIGLLSTPFIYLGSKVKPEEVENAD